MVSLFLYKTLLIIGHLLVSLLYFKEVYPMLIGLILVAFGAYLIIQDVTNKKN